MAHTAELAPSSTVADAKSDDSASYNPENQSGDLYERLAEAITPPAIEARTGKAWHDCDFEPAPGSGHETLSSSLREFYRDNYMLAADIASALIDPATLTPEERALKISELRTQIEASAIKQEDIDRFYNPALEYGNMPPHLVNFVRPLLAHAEINALEHPEDPTYKRTHLMLLATAVQTLFTESSVGISTISDQEKQLALELGARVKDRILASGLFYPNGKPKDLSRRSVNIDLLENPLLRIEDAQKRFWHDTRYAGQLLFHNSPDMPRSRQTGELLPRRMQKLKNGEIATTTAKNHGNSIHSPTIHWSELYDELGYKGHHEGAGTIAKPLHKIIETAPFARDSHYQMLRIKPDRLSKLEEQIPIYDGTTSIGSGGEDLQGFAGTDRTFYSSPRDVEHDAPIEVAPDGHVFDLGPADYAIANDEREVYIAMDSGLGESFPSLRSLDAPVYPDDSTWLSLDADSRARFLEDRKQAIEAGIAKLQHESISKLPDQVIVPVRSGIFDFYVHDDAVYKGRSQGRFYALPEAS